MVAHYTINRNLPDCNLQKRYKKTDADGSECFDKMLPKKKR